ncbi:hypothetical protein FQN50_000366 [Emmonsiellopsis sp. PD_5]|nr:hypothetical protein FQN50_000366 [Emmonsiellopsis sp. PD_5]
MFKRSSASSKPSQGSSKSALAPTQSRSPSSQHTTTDAGRDNGVRVEERGLYMVLWDTGVANKYHWGLVIAQTNTSGVLYHQTLSGVQWRFVMENKNLSLSKSILVALKVGVLEKTNDEWLAAVKGIVRDVTVKDGNLTCRTWALAALYELASAGFIGMQPNWIHIHEIEEEAKKLAEDSKLFSAKFVLPSRQSKP